MLVTPCPVCQKPVSWETTLTRPFCSDRCKTRDLGAWSAETYRLPTQPNLEEEEEWNGPDGDS